VRGCVIHDGSKTEKRPINGVIMAKSIIIICGRTDRTSPAYGQMNVIKPSILEMADKAGCVCTAWQPQRYTLDGGVELD